MFATAGLFHRASHGAFPQGRNGSLSKRLKFILRSWPDRAVAAEWFRLLENDPFYQKLAAHNHRLWRKLYRPYVSNTWDAARALAAVLDHYATVRARFAAPVVEKICFSQNPVIAAWRAGRTYELRLGHDERFYQEGEAALSLWCPELGNGELAVLSFTVARGRDGSPTLFIGGLQGADRALGASAIKDAGRDLHGLRPKSLMVIAVQDVAAAFGCPHIMATTNAGHAYSSDDRRQSKELAKMFFDYDAFWEECGGTRVDEAFFELPSVTPRRAREEMKPQKRPMYQRRYAMQDEIAAAVATGLPLAPRP